MAHEHRPGAGPGRPGRWTAAEATLSVDTPARAVVLRWHAGDAAASRYRADVSFYVDGQLVERSPALPEPGPAGGRAAVPRGGRGQAVLGSRRPSRSFRRTTSAAPTGERSVSRSVTPVDASAKVAAP